MLFPDIEPIVVSPGKLEAQEVRFSLFCPELTGPFQAPLELRAGRFHGSRTDRATTFFRSGVVQAVAMIVEVVNCPLDQFLWFFAQPGKMIF